jgi:phage virion morphogenesis protein
MAATGIQIKVDVERNDVGPALRRLLRRVGSPRPALSEMGSQLVKATRERFRRATGPTGTPWKSLSPATIAKRRKGSSKPLIDTGTLMRSIGYRLGSHSDLHVGTNHQLAPDVTSAIHQLGGKAGRGRKVTIPARPFLGLSRDDRRMIVATVGAYLGAPL